MEHRCGRAQEDKMDEVYDISEAARLFGITPGGVRYYESLGLIRPARSESGRRKYSVTDLQSLMFLRSVRARGLSPEEIREYFHCDSCRSLEDVGRFMAAKAQEMRRQAAYYKMLAQHTQWLGEALSRAQAQSGRLMPVTTQEYYVLCSKPLFGKGAAQQKLLARWIASAPICTMLRVAYMEEREITLRQIGFAIRKADADCLDLPLRDQAVVIPAAPSYEMILRVANSERFGLSDEEYQSIYRQVRQVSGWKSIRVSSTNIYTHQADGVREKFYRIWANPAKLS